MSFLHYLNTEHFSLSLEEFEKFLKSEVHVEQLWGDDSLLVELNRLGRFYYGSAFQVQNQTILNNRNAYLNIEGPRLMSIAAHNLNGLVLTNKVKRMAEEAEIWTKYDQDINNIIYNVNRFKFHLQGSLDLHFINAIHFRKGMFNDKSFKLKRFAAANLLNSAQEFSNFYKTGFLDLLSDKTQLRHNESALKGLPTAYYENFLNDRFFTLALITPEQYERYPFLADYEGLDYFHPFRVNRPLASYFTVTEKLVPLYSEFMDELAFQAYLKADDILENYIRERLKLPNKNESWISEVMLLRSLERRLPELAFIHQAKFQWLGRQSLDIYVIEKKLAIEYQGVQHFKSVPFFGGQDTYTQTMLRDNRKKDLCQQNGISLIHVLPNYNLQEVLDTINNCEANSAFYVQIGSL